MAEGSYQDRIMLAMTQAGARMFNNTVGLFELKDGRRLKTGLCPGSSDLIGWYPVLITNEMVGQVVAVFTVVEVKTPKSRTNKERLENQKIFIREVKKAGGIGGFAIYPEEALKHLSDFRGQYGAQTNNSPH